MRYIRKIVCKSQYWSSHGKHKGLLGICIQRNRDRARRARIRDAARTRGMYETVYEALRAAGVRT